MAIRLNKTGDHIQQGTVEYTADAASDIAALPTGVTPGSECFCIEESKTYILNNSKEWKEKKQGSGGGSGGGGGTSYPSADSRSFPLYNDDVTLLTQSQYYNDIAKAINEKTETDLKYTPAQMATAIGNIPDPTYQQKSLTPDFSSGNVDVTADSGYDALSQVTVQKDSNLIAENIKKDVTVHGITGSYEGGGGGTNPLKAMLERTATTIDDDILESIGYFAFYNYGDLTSVKFREVKNIYNYAFQNSSITSADFPKATSIGQYAFNNCRSLTSVSAPETISISNSAFLGCSSLTSANFPKAKSILTNAFDTCTSLTSANFPNATSISGSAFIGCRSLTSVYFPNLTGIEMNSFSNCTSLTLVDFPKVVSISRSAFNNCSSLSTLILRKDSMVDLIRINAFDNTPFSDEVTVATLYVPQALISSYENNSYWSQILAHEGTTIQAIEGSPYEET